MDWCIFFVIVYAFSLMPDIKKNIKKLNGTSRAYYVMSVLMALTLLFFSLITVFNLIF